MLILIVLTCLACQAGSATLPHEKRLNTPEGPPATLPKTVPLSGAPSLIVITPETATRWGRSYPGSALTVRAIEGLVNRDQPRIFVLQDGIEIHDKDWLNLIISQHGGSLITRGDANRRVDD